MLYGSIHTFYPASGKFLGRSLAKRCHMKAEYVPYLPSVKENTVSWHSFRNSTG